MLSASAPGAAVPDTGLQDWLRLNGPRLYLPSVSIAEVISGIQKARRTGATRRAGALEDWIAQVVHLYADRLLPLDLDAALVTGRLLDRARAMGHAPGFADIAIAGIAVARGLTLLTRNLRHFAPLGIAVLDPFAALPG